MLKTYASMTALGALALMAADGATGAEAPAASPGLTEFEFPNLEGKHSFDVATIPADVRLSFLKTGVRAYIANRLNGVNSRYQKDEKVVAWTAYEEATKADPLQSTVAKPDFEKPPAPDFKDAYDRAIADLVAGNVRQSGGEPKQRAVKDPLIATVTDAVVREVFAARRAKEPKFSFLEAKKVVGADGIAYLNAQIDLRVADVAEAEQPALRTALEKMRDTKYINPAKVMLGMTADKKLTELPSIL